VAVFIFRQNLFQSGNPGIHFDHGSLSQQPFIPVFFLSGNILIEMYFSFASIWYSRAGRGKDCQEILQDDRNTISTQERYNWNKESLYAIENTGIISE
jgi:hypothetical protein